MKEEKEIGNKEELIEVLRRIQQEEKYEKKVSGSKNTRLDE